MNAIFLIAFAIMVPGIQSQISRLSMSLATADAIAFETNASPVTFSFTSARVLPKGQDITINLPADYFTAKATPAVAVVMVNPVPGVVAPTATCRLVAEPQCTITCTIDGSALEAGAHRLVFGVGELSTGTARAVQTDGLTLSTSVDTAASASSPAIITHTIEFQNDADLFAQRRTSGFVNVSFFLGVALPSGGRITIHLPNGFFTANPQPIASLRCFGVAPNVACTLSAVSIICITSIRRLESGFVSLIFLPGTLTTGNSRIVTRDSFRIETSAGIITAASITPAIATGRIQNVRVIMSEADQFARKTTTSPITFAFTTQSDIPIGSSITVIFPANYFVAIANLQVRLQSSQMDPNVACTLANSAAAEQSLTCVTSGNALFAGDVRLTSDAGSLKTGPAATQNFLFVESTNNLKSVVGNMPAIKLGRIFGARMLVTSSDLFSNRMTQSNVEFFFSTIGDLSSGSLITILLPKSFFTSSVNPSASLIAISNIRLPSVTCQLENVNQLRIVCRISDAAPQIIVLSGPYKLIFPPGQFTLGSQVPETSEGLVIQSSEDLPSAGARTPRILVPQVISAQMKISQRDAFTNRTTMDAVEFSFFIESDLPVSSTITIMLPPQYFVRKSVPLPSVLCALCLPTQIPSVRCLLNSQILEIVCTTSNFILRAGTVTLLFPAGELFTGVFGGDFKISGLRIAASNHMSSVMIEAPSMFCAAGQGIAKNGECRPCNPGEFSSNPNTQPCQLCPVTAYSSNFMSTVCTPCGPSRSTGYAGAVAESECMCNDGLFMSKELKCVSCLRGGVCANSQMSSDRQFWSDTSLPSAQPIRCGFLPDACLAGSQCADGHFGFLCAQCKKGWFSFGGQCKPCNSDNNTQNILVIVFFCASLLIMILLTVKGSSASINAFIQMLQIETLALYIDTSIPPTVQTSLTSLSVFSLNPELLMLECNADVGDGPGDKESSMIYNLQVFISTCIVGTYSLASLGFLCMIAHLHLNRQREILAKVGRELSHASKQIHSFVTLTMHKLFACGLFIGLYVYLPVTVTSFEHMHCHSVAGFNYVKMKPQINCNSAKWRQTVLPNCVAGFVLFTAGIPIMFASMFWYTRKDRYNPIFLKSYAIFWNKYQPSFYWWEMVYTARKLVMAVIIIYLRDFYLFQTTVFCVSWIAFMIVHFNMNPYEYAPLNRIESSFYLGAFFSFLLTFFLRVSGDIEYRTTYVTLNLTITAAMIIYGMVGFVQELRQTSKADSILENAQHFNSLSSHLKDQTKDSSFVSREVEKYLQLLVSQSEIPETTLRWLQNSATDEEKRSLTLVLSCCSTLVLDQSELLSKRLSFREINFLENSVPNYLRYLVSESTSEERQILHRLFHQMVRWRFEAYFLDGYKTDLLSDWLLATDDFESAQDFVQIVFKLKHWYLRDELFQHIKKVPIFKKVSTEAIKALVSNVVLKVTKAGEVVILEGDTGDEMYFIVDGSVLILEKGERYTDLKTCKVIAELGRGSYFGEIVLLQGVFATRTRTVVCKTDCQLYVLNNDQFSVVMDIYPELRWSINQEAQRRANPANEDLILNSSCLDVAQEDAPEIIGDMRKSVQTKDLQNDNRREQVSSIVTSHSHGVASIESDRNIANASTPFLGGLLTETLVRKRPNLQMFASPVPLAAAANENISFNSSTPTVEQHSASSSNSLMPAFFLPPASSAQAKGVRRSLPSRKSVVSTSQLMLQEDSNSSGSSRATAITSRINAYAQS